MVRLRYAYADTLLAAGRETDALAWFHRTQAINGDQITDAEERADELDRPAQRLTKVASTVGPTGWVPQRSASR